MPTRNWIILSTNTFTDNTETAMIRKVFLDTNVVLDTMIRERESSVFSSLILGFDRVFDLCISVQSFPDIVYITRHDFDMEKNRAKFRTFLEHCSILGLGEANLSKAILSDCPDFEDAMQISSAEEANCDVIVTNNKKHFDAYTDIPVYTPKEFIEKLREVSCT